MHRTIVVLVLPILLMSALLALGQANNPAAPQPRLMIAVSGQSCAMTLTEPSAATPEATAEATVEAQATSEATGEAPSAVDYPVFAPGDGCASVLPLLYAPSNGKLWIALYTPNDFPWQQFRVVPDDPYPPLLDTRGRYVGCANPQKGEQTCRLLWDYLDKTYLLEIPLRVGNAYTAPAPAPTLVSSATPEPVVSNNGVWGDCGSCTTCGGPVEHCVLSPDNQCLWDAARCEPKGNP